MKRWSWGESGCDWLSKRTLVMTDAEDYVMLPNPKFDVLFCYKCGCKWRGDMSRHG